MSAGTMAALAFGTTLYIEDVCRENAFDIEEFFVHLFEFRSMPAHGVHDEQEFEPFQMGAFADCFKDAAVNTVLAQYGLKGCVSGLEFIAPLGRVAVSQGKHHVFGHIVDDPIIYWNFIIYRIRAYGIGIRGLVFDFIAVLFLVNKRRGKKRFDFFLFGDVKYQIKMVFLGTGKGNEISFVLFKLESFLLVLEFDIPLFDGRRFGFGFELVVGRAAGHQQDGDGAADPEQPPTASRQRVDRC